MAQPINFYSTRGPHGYMSNFFRRSLEWKGHTWRTSEHAYQAAKFWGHENHVKSIQHAATPMDAARMGREPARPVRQDWDHVKDDFMYQIIKAKFTHPNNYDLKAMLLSTGAAPLVEHTSNDNYWGDGGDGSGRNQLGITLMRVREELRNE